MDYLLGLGNASWHPERVTKGKAVQSDRTYQVLTPNCLMMGSTKNRPIRDKILENELTKAERFELIQTVTKHFWDIWAVEVTPDWMIRKKWHETGPNLKVQDIVLVHDKTPIKGHYIIAIVETVSTGKYGLVSSCRVGYGITFNTKDASQYKGRRWVLLLLIVCKDLACY